MLEKPAYRLVEVFQNRALGENAFECSIHSAGHQRRMGTGLSWRVLLLGLELELPSF